MTTLVEHEKLESARQRLGTSAAALQSAAKQLASAYEGLMAASGEFMAMGGTAPPAVPTQLATDLSVAQFKATALRADPNTVAANQQTADHDVVTIRAKIRTAEIQNAGTVVTELQAEVTEAEAEVTTLKAADAKAAADDVVALKALNAAAVAKDAARVAAATPPAPTLAPVSSTTLVGVAPLPGAPSFGAPPLSVRPQPGGIVNPAPTFVAPPLSGALPSPVVMLPPVSTPPPPPPPSFAAPPPLPNPAPPLPPAA
jgi:hypothetical protein